MNRQSASSDCESAGEPLRWLARIIFVGPTKDGNCIEVSNEELLPEITVTYDDLVILQQLVQKALAEGHYAAASRLGNELHRARIVSASHAPENCLGLNLAGRYLEERSGAVQDVVLVAGRGNPTFGTISALSQVGTALIGLSEGQRMCWLDPRGRRRAVRLLSVQRSGS